MNNKYFQTTNNKYLENKPKQQKFVKNQYFQKRMISKADYSVGGVPVSGSSSGNTSSNQEPQTANDMIWFDGRKFSDVIQDPKFLNNAQKLSPQQLDMYLSAAQEQLTQDPNDPFVWGVQVPDLAKEDVTKNPDWYKEYWVESTEHKSFVNDWLNDWQKYIPRGTDVSTQDKVENVFWNLWDDQVKRSRDILFSGIGSIDAMSNPFTNEYGMTPGTPEQYDRQGSVPKLGTIYDSSYRNASIESLKPKKGENPFYIGLSGNRPYEPKIKQEKSGKNPYFSVSIPGSPLMRNGVSFKQNKILVPGVYNPNYPPQVNVDPKNPFSDKVKVSSRATLTGGAIDPISEAFMARFNPNVKSTITPFDVIEDTSSSKSKTEKKPTATPIPMRRGLDPNKIKNPPEEKGDSWFDQAYNWWNESYGEKPYKGDNIYNNDWSYSPSKFLPSADTGTYDSGIQNAPQMPQRTTTPTPTSGSETDIIIGKSAKKRGSMNKMMGGKGGRMGPEIKDDDGSVGRYFQKKARKPVKTEKFYETDKPHGPQMRQMSNAAFTKALMRTARKMYEINNANYYGEEKPQAKNTFRKNNSMGNSINMGGSYSGTLMPRKKSYSIDTPRAKTPSPMNGVSHNPFFKPEGGSLKRYNPYPRSGGMATGMPPTMSGGFTAKRMTKKPVKTISVRAKYGC